ncbi:MAG: DNA polymerase III subunit delta' [Myxococcales bacterium]|nr:DNA polymerase III subunit delta' [Myxococcales bacterium]
MTLAPVLGHETARARLWGALERGSLHHALLLEGPRGVGKRLVALRLAMAANCTSELPWSQRPCGSCGPCRQIAAGTHPDVIVMEPDTTRAARTIPVEAVREVIRQSQYHRYAAAHRFVIVDPAEAMQEPAANALLKTLEEPPAGTGFLVISHNAKALLPTILSRCQRIRMGAVPVTDIEGWLGPLFPESEPAECAVAARLSLGCPGRAHGWMTDDGLGARRDLRQGLLQVLRAPLGDIYSYTGKLTSGGRQSWIVGVQRLLEILEDLLRDAAIVGAGSDLPLLNGDDEDQVRRWAERLWPEGLARCAEAVQECRDDLEVYVSGKTALDALLCTVRRELAGG